MSTLIESLKRLYISERIDKDKLNEFKENSKITEEEYNYITA